MLIRYLLKPLFIATLIRFEAASKYQAFGKELNSHCKKDFTVRLPIRMLDDGNPLADKDGRFSDEGFVSDWQYMKDYVSRLPYADRITSVAI